MILDILSQGPATTSEIARQLGKPAAAVNSTLSSMKRRGEVTSVSGDSGIIWTIADPEEVAEKKDEGLRVGDIVMWTVIKQERVVTDISRQSEGKIGVRSKHVRGGRETILSADQLELISR